uniref:Angiopoietin-1 receptor-like n=1 Tax=Saccoglossus kowalevskii TaxID=10224 RepID=A0ABM0MF46_SACKO
GYTAGIDTTTSFTFGRVIDTGTGDELPSDVYYVDHSDYGRRMTIQAGSNLPGVYYCDHSGFRLQTVLVASEADIYPESQTKTVSWGDDVTLTMTSQSTSITESQFKWKHNGVDIVAWNGQSSITITSAKPSDAGMYECYTTTSQRQSGKNAFMRLIVSSCPNGKYGDTCLHNCPTCYNGGICNADTGECICPPGFTGDDCNTGCARGYWGKSCGRLCSSVNTATACTGKMFCVSDPYGCSCLASHGGLDCLIEDCPSGTYGAGCTQICHCTYGCNTKGYCISSPGDCDAGWSASQEPTIMNVFSPELKQLEVHVQVPHSSDIKCKKDGVDGYIDYIEVKYRRTGTEDEYEIGKIEVYQEIVTGTKVITFTAESLLHYTEYDVIALLRNADATSPPSNSVTVVSNEDVTSKPRNVTIQPAVYTITATLEPDPPNVPSKPRNVTLQPAVYTITVTWLEPDPPNGIITAYKITYWKTSDESTKKDILVDNGGAHELNINNLDYEVNYTIIVSASTIVGEGEYSTEMNTKTSETIPREPASIDVQRTTENSIRFTWTDPTIFCGDILQYRITYRSTESVYSTTVLESKDILVDGDINTYTLEKLPRGTQFKISVSASTSKGFGKPNSIISGTTIDPNKDPQGYYQDLQSVQESQYQSLGKI